MSAGGWPSLVGRHCDKREGEWSMVVVMTFLVIMIVMTMMISLIKNEIFRNFLDPGLLERGE